MVAKRCFSWALLVSGRQTTSATRQSVRFFCILDWAGKEVRGNAESPSRAPFVAGVGRICSLLLALRAVEDAAKSANDADEGSAVRARVTFGSTLLIVAGATNHRVPLA
ncbi:MAG: hypothetical protein DMD72_09610 [Gemmatimonadetes bacterium]|nr:MAG: hypothetical protein DMD72_09610 [Gemmatimonadota bacterium]